MSESQMFPAASARYVLDLWHAFKQFVNEQLVNGKEFIAYHSTNSKIDNFDFNKIELKPKRILTITVANIKRN